MRFTSLRMQGLVLIEPHLYHDERGFFLEHYKQALFKQAGIDVSFVQDNVSYSKQGCVRALHYQQTPGQAKLVTCLKGSIWDVAVDIRKSSPTFGQWEAVRLDDVTRQSLFIPIGFAHGFCVLSSDALVQYKVSTAYDPAEEKSIRWNDPTLAIAWPIATPLLSKRDEQSPMFAEVVQ
ncbi:MAG: hypothetical protein RL235_825 [Chlamydiota bacterium]|jgi:dTDP-4-dehydrorhamnose 3,5-epimerase